MMTEQMVIEYLANSAWQIPLLAVGAWVLVKTVRPGLLVEHWVWLSVLVLAVVLPLRGIESGRTVRVVPAAMSLKSDDATVALLAASMAHEMLQPVESPSTHMHGVVLSVAATRWVLGLYAATILFGVLRLAQAWRAARRLVQESGELMLPPKAMRELEECAAQLHTVLPQLRETCEIAGPVVVGAMRPVLLLPEQFAEHAEEEIRAALLHELAHVRRRDYLVNLFCQVAALPVAWHPATRAIQQRIRMTREMVCDAVAAQEMLSNVGYAECLVSLATQMLSQEELTQAVGLFEKGTMEERVMRLTDGVATETMSGRAKAVRVACGAVAMIAVTVVAATFHVRPTFAAARAETAIVAAVQAVAPVAPVAAAKPSAAAPAVEAQSSEEAVAAVPAEQPQSAASSGVSSPSVVEDDGPTATAGEGSYVHRWVGTDGKKYVVVNRDPKDPTADERLKEEQKLKQLEGMEIKLDASGMKLQLKMDELQKSLAKIDVKKQMDEAKLLLDDPKMKQQMAELLKQINDPAWQRQIADAQKDAQLKVFDSLEWKKQVEDMQKNAKLFESPEWRKQFAELQKNAASLNAEQELQIAKSAIDSAKIDTKVSEKINAQVKVDMAEAQKELASGELKAKLEAAQRMLDEVRQQIQDMQKK